MSVRTGSYILAASLLLAGCAGNGPLGSGLGEVKGHLSVTEPNGATYTLDLLNGKDQTNLEVDGVSIGGVHIDRIHADKSDGATAGIEANKETTLRSYDTIDKLTGLATGAAKGGAAVATGGASALVTAPPS